MIVPDTNLLIYSYDAQSPFHDSALRWWEGLVNGSDIVGIPWIVSVGFVRLITHPRMLESPRSYLTAVEYVRDWFLHSHIMPITPGPDHMIYFQQNLAAAGIGGNLVPDAHIAALAMERGAEVHSNNADFGRFSGLRWVNPLKSEDG